MKVFIDGLGLPVRGGARSSMLGWIASLARYGPGNHYEVFLSRPEPVLDEFPQIGQRIVPIPSRFRVRIWAQARLPGLLRREGADLFHAMKALTIFGVPCKSIITINDLTHVVLAGLYPRIDGVYWQVVQRAMLRGVDHVIAISENTRRDILRTYGLAGDGVTVIHPSCSGDFQPVRDLDQEALLRSKYGISQPILLYAGGWAVHKNLQTLLAAYARISNRVPHCLVIVGGQHHTSSDTRLDDRVAELGLTGRVHLVGTVPDAELPHLYRMADLFVLPSLNEGFGLVLLEAMASGTPALASGCSSLPEVGGEAVAWVSDPMNVEEWSRELLRLLGDEGERARMRDLGLARAGRFRWEDTARATLTLYERLVSPGR